MRGEGGKGYNRRSFGLVGRIQFLRGGSLLGFGRRPGRGGGGLASQPEGK